MSQPVGALPPNWFDGEFTGTAAQMTAEELLEEIAGHPRIVAAVQAAMDKDDADRKAKIMGPSRTQLVRKALVEVLEAAT